MSAVIVLIAARMLFVVHQMFFGFAALPSCWPRKSDLTSFQGKVRHPSFFDPFSTDSDSSSPSSGLGQNFQGRSASRCGPAGMNEGDCGARFCTICDINQMKLVRRRLLAFAVMPIAGEVLFHGGSTHLTPLGMASEPLEIKEGKNNGLSQSQASCYSRTGNIFSRASSNSPRFRST